jgi:DNA-binding transcriptional regulator YiaG
VLIKDKKQKLYLIHRLVAEYFIDNSKLHLQVNHIDCNKQNNHVSNLEWVTTKENMRHAVENGLWTSPTNEHYKMMRKNARVNNAKFTLEEADDILEMKDVLKLSIRELSRITGVNRTTLSKLADGTTKHFKNGVLA